MCVTPFHSFTLFYFFSFVPSPASDHLPDSAYALGTTWNRVTTPLPAPAWPRVGCCHLEPTRAAAQPVWEPRVLQRQPHSLAGLQSSPRRGTRSEWKHMDLRGVGVCLFLNCIKPFHCLESSTFFKAAEHGARLQFAFSRSPAFRAPKNNEPPPSPPLQLAKGRRKASSRLPPNHLTCLDAFSSPLEGTGNFFLPLSARGVCSV